MKGSKKLNRVLLGLEMVNGDVIIKILLRFICVYYTSINIHSALQSMAEAIFPFTLGFFVYEMFQFANQYEILV